MVKLACAQSPDGCFMLTTVPEISVLTMPHKKIRKAVSEKMERYGLKT